MDRIRGEIWKFIPSGDWFYIEKRGDKYFMSLRVIGPAQANRIINGKESPPEIDREVISPGAFERVPEEAFAVAELS